MDDKQFQKLPKFAQEEIASLRRQRDTAVNALNKWLDEQTISSISISEMLHLGDGSPSHITRYIQGHKLEIKHGGVLLRIRLSESGGFDSYGINLQWGCSERELGPIAFVPKSYQQAELISKENMR